MCLPHHFPHFHSALKNKKKINIENIFPDIHTLRPVLLKKENCIVPLNIFVMWHNYYVIMIHQYACQSLCIYC